jgi:hypothetical protein
LCHEDDRAMARKRGRISGRIVEVVNGVPYVVIKYNDKCLNIQIAGTLGVTVDTRKFSAMVEIAYSLPSNQRS